MKDFVIIEIFMTVLDQILLELHINVQNENKKNSLALTISDDGETILYNQNDSWVTLDSIKNNPFLVKKINYESDDLGKLINNRITSIQYGIGKTLDTKKDILYYVKINTDVTKFLFFNNGDKGEYSFDRIDDILQNDIYGYRWTEHW